MKTDYWFGRDRLLSHLRFATAGTFISAAAAMVLFATLPAPSAYAEEHQFTIVYQITDNVFFRAAPAVTFSSGGSSTVKYKNGATPDSSGDGSAFQFELVSGFGANFSL